MAKYDSAPFKFQLTKSTGRCWVDTDRGIGGHGGTVTFHDGPAPLSGAEVVVTIDDSTGEPTPVASVVRLECPTGVTTAVARSVVGPLSRFALAALTTELDYDGDGPHVPWNGRGMSPKTITRLLAGTGSPDAEGRSNGVDYARVAELYLAGGYKAVSEDRVLGGGSASKARVLVHRARKAGYDLPPARQTRGA